MVKESQILTKIETIIDVSDNVRVYDNKQDTELSSIANRNIALGAIGDSNSILANVTIIKKEDN